MSIYLLLVLLPPLMLRSQLVLVVNNFGFRPSYFLWVPSYLAPRGFVPRSSGGSTLEQLRMLSPRAWPGLAWPGRAHAPQIPPFCFSTRSLS